MGKINFLRRFIPNLAENMRLITNMLKKDEDIKWTVEARSSFENIKHAIGQSFVLISPYYTKHFIIFSFNSEHTIDAFLLQKNKDDQEQPIAFFSRALKDARLGYTTIEK